MYENLTHTDLHRWGYRLHCTYSTKGGEVLKCLISFDLLNNLYAFELGDKVISFNLEGKDKANEFFRDNLLSLVDPLSKKVHPRKHIFYIHYHDGRRNKDVVCIKSGSSLEQVEADWLKAYQFAIINHGYSLEKIVQAY